MSEVQVRKWQRRCCCLSRLRQATLCASVLSLKTDSAADGSMDAALLSRSLSCVRKQRTDQRNCSLEGMKSRLFFCREKQPPPPTHSRIMASVTSPSHQVKPYIHRSHDSFHGNNNTSRLCFRVCVDFTKQQWNGCSSVLRGDYDLSRFTDKLWSKLFANADCRYDIQRAKLIKMEAGCASSGDRRFFLLPVQRATRPA